jgi:hypothetical protein
MRVVNAVDPPNFVTLQFFHCSNVGKLVSLALVSSLRQTARVSGLPGWFVFNFKIEHERFAFTPFSYEEF